MIDVVTDNRFLPTDTFEPLSGYRYGVSVGIFGVAMKTCNTCIESLNNDEFNKDKNTKDGLSYTCRRCTKIRKDVWLKNNPEKNSLYCRKYSANNPEKKRVSANKWRIENKSKQLIYNAKHYKNSKHIHKYKAYRLFQKALKQGRLIKLPCHICGNTKAEAHHEDYSKPLDVLWLCKRHHEDRHIELRKAGVVL